MYKRVLLALDLEGVNMVVGEPYCGLSRDTEQWHIARNQAVLEVNAAAEALFEAGVESVGLWDNHGGGSNVDAEALDRQLTLANCDDRRTLPFHQMLLNDELPLTIGGGIGQSRLCMLMMGCAHIGEVQSSIWDAETVKICEENRVRLL